MEKIIIRARSGAHSAPYEVQFERKGDKIRVFCTCAEKTGDWKAVCEHKTALCAGDTTMLDHQDQVNELMTVGKWIAESPRLRDLQMDVQVADARVEAERIKANLVREALARAMSADL